MAHEQARNVEIFIVAGTGQSTGLGSNWVLRFKIWDNSRFWINKDEFWIN